MKLSANIGGVRLNSCLMNAAGCWCSDEQELTQLVKSVSGAIVSKSATLKPREGHAMPRLKMTNEMSINAMGVPNKGLDFYISRASKYPLDQKPFIYSLYPSSQNELATMLNKLTNKTTVLIELNLSCPNLSTPKDVFIGDMKLLRSYLHILRLHKQCHPTQQWIMGLKLPPLYYSRDWDHLCQVLLEHKDTIRFVTTINSVANGLSVNSESGKTDIHPRGGFGGIGGSLCKPIGLANVRALYTRLKGAIDIIGCGGIQNASDVLEYILCGASAVQIGSYLLQEGPECFTTISKELTQRVASLKKKVKDVQSLVGTLQVTSPWTSTVQSNLITSRL